MDFPLYTIPYSILNKYKQAFLAHPVIGKAIENGLQVSSQLISVNFRTTAEGLDSVANLLSIYNDKLYLEASYGFDKISFEQLLNYAITILENVEVFVELLATKRLTVEVRWIIIATIVFLKSAFKLILLSYKRVMQRRHPMLKGAAERKILYQTTLINGKVKSSEDDKYYVLQRSGRKLRKLAYTPPRSERDWNNTKPKQFSTKDKKNQVPYFDDFQTRLDGYFLLGEILNNLKQVISLGMIYFLGYGKLSFFIQLAIDLSSIAPYLLIQKNWTPEEQKEIRDRLFHLLVYLIKAPFAVLIQLLSFFEKGSILSNFMPMIIQALQNYQHIFFYMH